MDISADLTIVLVCLAIAAGGIALLAIGHRLRLARRDPVRMFSWTQKKLLITRAGGQCEHKPLLWRRCPATGRLEADHIIPWSKGGTTELHNSQLLCRRHNARKSNHMPGRIYRWRLENRRRRGDASARQFPSFRTRGVR